MFSPLNRKQISQLDSVIAQMEARIEALTRGTVNETVEEKQARIAGYLSNDGFPDFCAYYFPHICTAPIAPFHKEMALELISDTNAFLVRQWPRGHAKTTMARIAIIWMVARKEVRFGLLASSDQVKAMRLLGEIQAELRYNKRLRRDFDFKPMPGSWVKGDFSLTDGTTFRAYGKGQNPRGEQANGQRPDFIWLDDIDDDREVRNPARVDASFKWVMEALYMAGQPGKTRFLCINNAIGKDTITTRLSNVHGAKVSIVKAIDEEGNLAWPELYSLEKIKGLEAKMGYFSAQKELYNNPIIEGKVFRNESIKWGPTVPLAEYDQVMCYYDPSLSDTGDFKAVAVVGRIKDNYHVLRMFCRQCPQAEVVRWCYDIHDKLRNGCSPEWLMEGIMWQHSLIDAFTAEGVSRGWQLPIRADNRSKGNKEARIQGLSIWFERGVVTFNHRYKNCPDMQAAINQLLAFGEGSRAHDDAPDALEGAIWQLNKRIRRNHIAVTYSVVHRPTMHNLT